MTRRSSISIGYPDLVEFMQKQVNYQTRRYNDAIGNTLNLNGIKHDKECAERLLKMLKKCEPKVQADLFELFEQTKK